MMELFELDGLADNERCFQFGGREDRIVKVEIFDTTASQERSVQEVQKCFKAKAYRVNADGSLIQPDKPLEMQPGFIARTTGVPHDAVARDSLALGNAIGELVAAVAEKAIGIAIAAEHFSFPAE